MALNRRSPRFVFLFLLVLFLPQGIQFARQFLKGYRPFSHDPTPVYFSWDMFANPIERCFLEWKPALTTPQGKTVNSILELGPNIEWGVVYNRVSTYQSIRQYLCHLTGGTAHTRLDCFLPNGQEFKDESDCPKI